MLPLRTLPLVLLRPNRSPGRGRRLYGAALLTIGAVGCAADAAQSPAAPPVAQTPAASPAGEPTPAGPRAGGTGPTAATAPTRTLIRLTLDGAVQTALERNPSQEQAQAAIRRAEAVVAEARALQMPRLDAGLRLALQGPIPSFTFGGPAAGGGAGGGNGGNGGQPGQPAQQQTIRLGNTFTRTVDVGASYDIDPFGRLRINRSLARQNVNVARASFGLARNELVFGVQSVYLAALRAQELIAVTREAVAAAEEQRRVAAAQFSAGTAPEFDVLRASVQVANLRQNQVTAEANYRRTAASLAELLSLEPTAGLELAPVELPPEPVAVAVAVAQSALEPASAAIPAVVPQTLETALEEAYRRRPEVSRAEWQRRVAETRVRFERLGNRPSAGVTTGFVYAPDQAGLAVVTKTWSLVTNINLPLWDGGLTRARTRQARADVAIAAAQEREARDGVAEEVRRSLVDLEEATERRRAAAANTSQAREALRIARVRYQAGLAPNVEVTDAEVALTQSRTNEVNAAFDYLTSLANLNRSMGRYAGDTLVQLTR